MPPQVKKKRIAGILQPGYLPWLGFFEQMYYSDVFVYFDDVQYSNNSWRNRNRIKTPSGPLWLTVPVSASAMNHGFPAINEVKIARTISWRKKHLCSIRQNYSKARFYRMYIDELTEVINKDHIFLADLDVELIELFKRWLGIKTETLRSSDLKVTGSGMERIVGILEKVDAEVFYEGAAGREYMEPEVFALHGKSIVFQEYLHPSYYQMHGVFVPYLSVLDLLFNCGSESLEIILQ